MDSTGCKIAVSAALVAVAVAMVVLLIPMDPVQETGSEGIVIDFSEYDTQWAPVRISSGADARTLLEDAASGLGLSVTFADDGSVEEIGGVRSDGSKGWGLWVIERGSTEWKSLPAPYDSPLDGYAVSSFAYRSASEVPSVAVDQMGTPVYGYGQSMRIVTLSPTITEMVAALGGVKSVVGTDYYSDHPGEVVRLKESGDIKIVGDYTTPSFESIVNLRPDIVLCDGCQYNHVQISKRLTELGICALVTYDSEDVGSIRDNLFMIGVAMGYEQAAVSVIEELDYAMEEIDETLGLCPYVSEVPVAVALSPEMSPWVSGNYTYASDILTRVFGMNSFMDQAGWVHINSEQMMAKNPSRIIILTADYAATQEEYDSMMSGLSEEWKATDAYRNGEIYLIAEEAGEMAQRSGPRYAQLAELMARIMNPDAFGIDGMPHFIGDGYDQYLTITKDLGFEG